MLTAFGQLAYLLSVVFMIGVAVLYFVQLVLVGARRRRGGVTTAAAKVARVVRDLREAAQALDEGLGRLD